MISFSPTEDQEIARSMAANFARQAAAPGARQADEAGEFPSGALEAVWKLGLVQTVASGDLPEQPTVLNALVLEELGHGDAALAMALAASLGFVKAIAENGSRAQKRAHLPAFAADEPRWAAIAHTDAGWLRGAGKATRAEKAGGGWRIDGAKALIPLAGRCERFLVTAATSDGQSAFVVAASAPGVRVAPAMGTLGMRALQMADVAFEGVIVDEDARLAIAPRRIVDSSRVALSAILAGVARAVYEYSLPYTKQRIVHGEAIARKQAVAFKLADMHIAVQAMRWMGLRAAAELDACPTSTRNARLAQRYAAEHGLKVADEGVQVFGGYGFVRDLPLEMWYRNARSLSVLDGCVGV